MPKRTQVQIFGPIERTLELSLDAPPLQQGSHVAHARKWLLSGDAVHLGRELTGLGFTSGLVARVGNDEPGRNILARLRRDNLHTGMIQKDLPFETTLSVQIRSPRQTLEFRSASTPRPIAKSGLAVGLKAIRHLHVCEDALMHRPQRLVQFALRNANNYGATTSVQLARVDTLRDADLTPKLFANVDILFTRSGVLRSLVHKHRLAEAVEEVMSLGIAKVFVDLDSGGSRVYDSRLAVRVPRMGRPTRNSVAGKSRIVAPFLAGQLLGGSAAACAVLAEAARGLEDAARGKPDRRVLRQRIIESRTDPGLRKLIDALREADRLMATRRTRKRAGAAQK